MRLLSWRLAVAIFLAAVCFSLASPPSAFAQVVRKSITEFTPAELMSLRRGVATMMARNTAPRGSSNFRRSWVYWANVHGHFGPGCRGAVRGGGMTGVRAWTATNPNEAATWCKCEHGTDQFATWHRMYLFFFERVLQQAANDPALTLPFWDYATDPMLPEAFRVATYVNASGQTVPNPLRVAGRRNTLNNGAAGLAPATTSASNAMSATSFATFRVRMESSPHGAVHCAIGSGGCPTGLMGSVPSAALDPIFYLHHVNIDRLYECWLKVDETGRLPASAQILDTSYSFVDSDGAVRSRRVRDMLTTTQLGYEYATGGGCPVPVVAELEMTDMAPTELRRGVTTVPMSVESTSAAPDAADVDALRAPGVAAAPPVRSATVVIAGLTAAQVPGVLYNVYLANERGQREQIGVIDFFGFDGGFDGGGGHAGHGADAAGRRFEFDATAAVERLGLEASRSPKLVFEPTTGLSDSTPASAADAIGPEAKVSFKRAWLKVDR